jgi:hypothetical protein
MQNKASPEDGTCTLEDGTKGITYRGLCKRLNVCSETLRRIIQREEFEVEAGKSSRGRREKRLRLDDKQIAALEKKYRHDMPPRIHKRCTDGKVRVFLRSDLAAALLKVTRTYLWIWQTKGCQHLDGAKLISTSRRSRKSRPVVYYLEEQINKIKKAREAPKCVPAPDMPLTLSEAAAQTQERGPSLSRMFIFRNLTRTIERTGQDSRFIPGGIPSEEVTPPSIHGKGKPQYTILPSDLLCLQSAVRTAFRKARKQLRVGWGTAADVERELGAGHGRDRAHAKRRLYELVEGGRLERERAWRTFGNRIRQMAIYPISKAVALVRGEEGNEPRQLTDDNTEPFSPTPFQSAILGLLDGRSMIADDLQFKLKADRRRLYYGSSQDGKGGLMELIEHGLVEPGKGKGIRGYYRPDRPPALSTGDVRNCARN